jgi:hypothetical protein
MAKIRESSRARACMAAWTMADVPDGKRVHVDLEIEPDAEPIRGRLSIDGGGCWDFTGWLAFVRALDEALATDVPPAR